MTDAEWLSCTDPSPMLGHLERGASDRKLRRRAGLWIASTRVEKFNDRAVSARCKRRGMSRAPSGVLALAALEAARCNGELDEWRRVGELPERPLPEPIRRAA